MIKDIQYLRAISVIAVVVFHTSYTFRQLPLTGSGLWTGVDVFLVVSGFVIARSLLPDLEAAHHPLSVATGFWIKRVYRLLQAAVFWASIAVLLGLFVNRTGIFGRWTDLLWEYARALLYVQNLPLPKYALSHYWSLSLEEQFYLLLPLGAVFVPALVRPLGLAAIGAGGLVAISVRGLEPFIGDFRIAPLVAGILLFHLSRTELYRRLEPTWIRGRIRSLVVIGSFAALFVIGSAQSRWIGVTAVATWIVWLASYDKGYISLPGFDPILRWIGDRSYSIYLAHVSAIFLTYEIAMRAGSLNSWVDVPIAWSLALCVAAASYRWIEVPSQSLGTERRRIYLERHAARTIPRPRLAEEPSATHVAGPFHGHAAPREIPAFAPTNT